MKASSKQSPAVPMMAWAVVWLAAALGGPVAMLLLIWRHTALAIWIGGSAVVFHLLASRMIVRCDAQFGERSDSSQLAAWLFLGGWALMLCVFFAGCALSFSHDPL